MNEFESKDPIVAMLVVKEFLIDELAHYIAPVPIPPRFTRCYMCELPASQLICFQTAEDCLSNPVYPEDTDANNVAALLRSIFKGNIELPCCDEHEPRRFEEGELV